MKNRFLLFITILLSIANLTFGGTTGKLTGKIIDKSTGEPLPFVNVLIEGTMLGAATDLNGNYVILNIPPGKYKVKARYVGYRTVVVENVIISIDLTTRQNFQLSPETIKLKEIVVNGSKELIRKDVTATEARVTASEIAKLPVASLSGVIQLQAGVTTGAGGDFHIRGGRSSEISYWVNGISITDAYDHSNGLEIDNNSVQELQVISGTFNAEYGQAMSGIINTVTKEGGQSYKGFMQIYSGGHLSNFTEVFPHINHFDPVQNYNFEANVGGPIPFTNKKATFFMDGRQEYRDGWLFGFNKYTTTGKKADGKAVGMNWSRTWLGQLNLSYWASKYFKFNLEGLFSKRNYQDYNHFFAWEPYGRPYKFSTSYNTTFTMTNTFSSSAFFTLRASWFKHKYQSYLYKNPYDPRYLAPDSLHTMSYAFTTKGTDLGRFFRSTDTYTVKFDFTSQVSQHHLMKVGSQVRKYRLNIDGYTLVPKRNSSGSPIVPFVPSIPGPTELNRELYTVKPLEMDAYIEDKIEYKNVIINVGVRLDYFDANSHTLVDPQDPNIYIPLRPGLDSLSLKQREPYFYKKTKPKWQVSPRLGVAYPISAEGVVRFSYGYFLQIPSFRYLYDQAAYKVPTSGTPGVVYGNPDLNAQKTIMYEIGFKQGFFNTYTMDVTAYYRDIRNWITAGTIIETMNGVPYSRYVNKDYANVKGITFNFSKRFSNHWSFNLNYTYQDAEGTNSRPEDAFNAQRSDQEPSLFLIPLDWDQRHLVNLNFYVGGASWGASLIARYGTGLPYTPSLTANVSERGITSGFTRNSRRRPSQFSMDLRLSKSFKVFNLNITTFLRIFNLLDNHVVVNVFSDTGSPDYTTVGKNVGYDPNRPNTVAQYLISPWNYGEPRRVQFGFEFSL